LTVNERAAAAYIRQLLDLTVRFQSLQPRQRDELWLKCYEMAMNLPSFEMAAPLKMALIHPDFYFREQESFRAVLPWERNGDFSAGVGLLDLCESEVLTGVACPANSFPSARGVCVADHRWPHSLGGPSMVENRLLLCRFHNGMKSNDVSRFNWVEPPSWLDWYLSTIARLKGG
jgi:hypothetical protein